MTSVATAVAVLSLAPAVLAADAPFATPVFGIATAPDGSLLVADAGAGVVRVTGSPGSFTNSLVVELPGADDVAPLPDGGMFILTGIGMETVLTKPHDKGQPRDAWDLFVLKNGHAKRIADLLLFEKQHNPDGGVIDSNPFDVAALSSTTALVADAGGNDLLVVDGKGDVDWVATLPDELVSTANIKALVGCPTPPPPLADVCGLPAMIPAQAVATSVSVGPDGAYYVGELKGFPAPLGESRVWRIAPGTRHANCATSSACTVVADGFTSIVDLNFGPDGTLYVTEIDEAGFAAIELQFFFGLPGLMQGGTVNACDVTTWSCSVVATGLTIPIATTVASGGTVYALTEALLPTAKVIALP